MKVNVSGQLSGRRAEAARNDGRILEAARAVFTKDPDAPISAVAERAGVGMSALYRRYRSKDELLQRLNSEGMQRYLAEAKAALDHDGDEWAAFDRFMRNCVDSGAGSLTLRLAGTFTPTEELQKISHELYLAVRKLVARTKVAGVLRPDITEGDVTLVFEQLQAIHVGDDERDRQLRQRYLSLLLQAFRAPSDEALPGPAPSRDEIRHRYDS